MTASVLSTFPQTAQCLSGWPVSVLFTSTATIQRLNALAHEAQVTQAAATVTRHDGIFASRALNSLRAANPLNY